MSKLFAANFHKLGAFTYSYYKVEENLQRAFEKAKKAIKLFKELDKPKAAADVKYFIFSELYLKNKTEFTEILRGDERYIPTIMQEAIDTYSALNISEKVIECQEKLQEQSGSEDLTLKGKKGKKIKKFDTKKYLQIVE